MGEHITKRNICRGIQRQLTSVKVSPNPHKNQPNSHSKIQDWEETIDTSFFFGRIEEISILKQWIRQDKCRLVSILGMGGIGKTLLAARSAEHLKGDFDYIIWRSVRHLPSLDQLLKDILQVFSPAQINDLAENTNNRINRLLGYLKKHRCLLILDNYESIVNSSKDIENNLTSPPAPLLKGEGSQFPLKGNGSQFPLEGNGSQFPLKGEGSQFPLKGEGSQFPLKGNGSQFPPFPRREGGLGGLGQYLPGYEEYGQLLRRIGEEYHQSCLLFTSREKPRGLAAKEG